MTPTDPARERALRIARELLEEKLSEYCQHDTSPAHMKRYECFPATWNDHGQGDGCLLAALSEAILVGLREAEHKPADCTAETCACYRAGQRKGAWGDWCGADDTSRVCRSTPMCRSCAIKHLLEERALREKAAWEDRCLKAEQELAIAGVRGSPPLGGEEPTIPRLLRQWRGERALADRLAEALLHSESLDSLWGCPPDNLCHNECSELASEIVAEIRSVLAEHAKARQ